MTDHSIHCELGTTLNNSSRTLAEDGAVLEPYKKRATTPLMQRYATPAAVTA